MIKQNSNDTKYLKSIPLCYKEPNYAMKRPRNNINQANNTINLSNHN